MARPLRTRKAAAEAMLMILPPPREAMTRAAAWQPK